MSVSEGVRFVNADGLKIRVKSSPDLGFNVSKPAVVLFHGFSFSLDVWEEIGTYDELARRAIPYLAVDLPRGKETKSQKKKHTHMSDYVPLLESIFRSSGIDVTRQKLVIIGPSMGGAFALAYALQNKSQILGLVLVAPSLAGLNREDLEGLDIPVLLAWGEKDNVFPVEQNGRELKEILPQAKLLIIKGAHHPAYLDRPQEFHDLLFDFIEEISS